jgi:hypothetical protein
MLIPDMASVFSRYPKFEYILYDACFMQTVEVVYELRAAAKYIIGSPAELPGRGAPYKQLMPALFLHDSEHKIAEAIVNAYGSYYNSYYTLSSIMLNYEELLHNTRTRELIEKGFVSRREGLARIFQGALDNGEIIDDFTAEMLADMLLGIFVVCSLNRRVLVRKKSYHEEIKILSGKWLDTIKK